MLNYIQSEIYLVFTNLKSNCLVENVKDCHIQSVFKQLHSCLN